MQNISPNIIVIVDIAEYICGFMWFLTVCMGFCSIGFFNHSNNEEDGSFQFIYFVDALTYRKPPKLQGECMQQRPKHKEITC